MKCKFKIGDRVKIRLWDDMAKEFGVDRFGDIESMPFFVKNMKHLCGRTATITGVSQGIDRTNVFLKFDDTDCNFERWQYTTDMIAPLVPNEKIVITTDGTTTTAKMYRGKEVIKTATANCSRDDEFNFETGAKIAFDRLMFNFKVGDKVKIINNTKSYHHFKIGDVVTIVGVGDDCDRTLTCKNLVMMQRVSPCDVVYVAEPKKPKFTKSDLKTGMFLKMSNGSYAVVVDDKIVYEQKGYDRLSTMYDDLTYSFYDVDAVIDAVSFSDARAIIERDYEGGIIWRRGTK